MKTYEARKEFVYNFLGPILIAIILTLPAIFQSFVNNEMIKENHKLIIENRQLIEKNIQK